MKEANNLFVKIKMEIPPWRLRTKRFSDENALKVAVRRFCYVSNSIRHVSRYFLISFCKIRQKRQNLLAVSRYINTLLIELCKHAPLVQ